MMNNTKEELGGLNTTNIGRVDSIDIIRGFAIFCVVWGHVAGCYGCTVDDALSRILTTFNMPLFALIGGILFKTPQREKYIQWISRKAARLIVPGTFWYLVVGMCYYIKSHGQSWHSISLWYLWGISIVYLLVGTISIIVPSNTLIIAVCIANLALWFVPHDLYYAGFLMPSFIIGMVIRRHTEQIIDVMRVRKIILMPVSTIAYLVMLYFFKTDYYIYFGGISFTLSSNVLLQFYVNFYRIIMGTFAFAILFYAYDFLKGIRISMFSDFLKKAGVMSLSIYIFHVIAITPMLIIIPGVLANNEVAFSKIGGVLIAIPTAIILMIGCMLFTKLIEKVPVLNKIAV